MQATLLRRLRMDAPAGKSNLREIIREPPYPAKKPGSRDRVGACGLRPHVKQRYSDESSVRARRAHGSDLQAQDPGGTTHMTDLERWLKTLGLEQYARTFHDNDIDFDALAEATAADLERLGLSLGHQLRLLGAMKARRHDLADPENRAAAASQAPDAQRRQVTVMFCDLVGSTELAHQIDPEEMSAFIRRYQDICSAAITQFDGFVAKFMGDGVLAYFGYPRANEDAPEHAVHAALAVVDCLRSLVRPDGRAARARIGISTGLVVIGDVVGVGSAREHSITGDTPNLAARLQGIAEPDAILIGPSTRRLLGEQFEYESLGNRLLKGFTDSIGVWRVTREATAGSRFAATRSTADTAFIGRADETHRLLERWRLASQGRGQAVVIAGDAGMGKSRLVEMLCERLREGAHATCQCSPYHANSALHPVIRYLQRVAGFAPDDSDSIKLGKLERWLGASNADDALDPDTSLVSDLLSLPTDRRPLLELSAPERKAATLDALVRHLKRRADRGKPALIILEDAHWIDPTTLELWTRLIDGIGSAHVLTIVTARTEFSPPWLDRPHVSTLELARFSSIECADLVAQVAMPRVLPHAIVEDIVAKADGVPLFVEELTKSVLEASVNHPAVPATLQDSLMERLDRLGTAKEIAQVAAVIGQQFSHALLASVVSLSDGELRTGLEQLVAVGIAHRQGDGSGSTYRFKHALLRDIAYENLLRARRRQLHERIARVIVSDFAAMAEAEPEVVAYHFAQAGLFELASIYRERAGGRASARSSYAEAVAHFTTALTEAAHIKQPAERMRRELEMLVALGPPLTIINGPQSSAVEDLYQRAHRHATTLADEPGLFKATWGLWYNAVFGRRLDRARDYADALVAVGERSGNEDWLLEGLHCRWATAMFRGEVATALAASRTGIDRYDRARHSWMGPVFGGHDPGVCACVAQTLGLALRGLFVQARRATEEGIALADALKHPNTTAHVLLNALVSAQIGGDCASVERLGSRAIDLADKFNLPTVRSHALFISGWGRAFQGDLASGLKVMEAEFPRASAIGPYFRYYAALLAEGRARSARLFDALEVLRSALETVTEPGVGIFVSELYRQQGVYMLQDASPNEDAAMQSLETAVDIAARQTATLLHFRALLSLARASMAIGVPTRALGALRAFCGTLPAEFTAPDLAEARQLLSH